MKVLLILPPISLEERYNKHIAKAAGTLPPLGLLYLAAVLKDTHEVKVFDGSMHTSSELFSLIKSFKPEFVGIQSMTLFWPTIKILSRKIKEILGPVHISVGGSYTTIAGKQCLEEAKEIDSIVLNEAEETIKELVDSLEKSKDLKLVKGIIFRKKNKIYINDPRPLIKNIDKIPFPARKLVDIERYIPAMEQYKRLPVTNIYTTRGCPYSCNFCWRTMGRITRFRSPENVIEEIKILHYDYGIKDIAIWDDTFTLDRKRTFKIMKLLQKENLDIIFSAQSRVNLVDEELLAEMKKSGCWKIFFGIESMLQKNLDVLQKGTTVQQNYDAVRLTNKIGIESEASIMFGLPGETYKDCLETINRVIKLNPTYSKFFYLTPYFDEFRNKISDYGTFVTEDLNEYNESKPVFIPHSIKKEQLQKILPKAYKSFYLRPGYILRHLSRINGIEDVKRAFNGLSAVLSL